ncbi:hypothetical protein [Nitrosopumilus ureiphilus]|nr:hypothetical protein [Nitrosopumilus ureiphilus]
MGWNNSKFLFVMVFASLILIFNSTTDVIAEEKNPVTGSSISWNEGKIKWLETSYPSTGTAVVQLIDPDMNLNSEKVDNFDVDVWSDTDFAGIDLTMTETDVSSGIFEGTVFFTITDDSSGHRLRVLQGDTIYTKYDDITISETNKNYKLVLIGTATIDGDSVSVIENRITLDKESYVWDDDVSITLVAPELNLDNKSIEKIDDPEKFPIEITTRHFEIKEFNLVETGIDTGIFSGEITLKASEFPNPDYNDSDGISVNFEYAEDNVAIGSAPIILNSFESYAPSVSFDRDVYPVPFGSVDDFADMVSSTPDGRSLFPVHLTAVTTGNLQESETLGSGDLMTHIRIHDANFDISQNVDKIIQDVNGKTVGPLKISVIRDSQTMVLAYAGGSTPNDDGLIDVNDNSPTTARQMGSISEVSPDSGVFELDLAVRYFDGPSSAQCPVTAMFTSLNNDAVFGSEESRFDEPSTETENYCILKGDVLTVEYTYLDEQGNVNVVTDSATFDLRNGTLEANQDVYIIGSDMILTLTDPDLDLDNDKVETYPLDLIEWDSSAATLTMGRLGGEISAFDPEPLNFRETGDSTGVFQLVVEIPHVLQDTYLERGEEIVLEYTDWSPSGASYVGNEEEDVDFTISTSNFGATVNLDKKDYTWNDKVYITVVSPNHNFDSDLVDEIGNIASSKIKISTRQFNLDNYKLVETGTNTGTFTGEVTLVGHVGNMDTVSTGKGPVDGVMPASSKDGITVEFELTEDETVVGSALIKSDKKLSPLKQQLAGVSAKDVVCNDGFSKLYKSDNSAICVKFDTISKLMERGWDEF